MALQSSTPPTKSFSLVFIFFWGGSNEKNIEKCSCKWLAWRHQHSFYCLCSARFLYFSGLSCENLSYQRSELDQYFFNYSLISVLFNKMEWNRNYWNIGKFFFLETSVCVLDCKVEHSFYFGFWWKEFGKKAQLDDFEVP